MEDFHLASDRTHSHVAGPGLALDEIGGEVAELDEAIPAAETVEGDGLEGRLAKGDGRREEGEQPHWGMAKGTGRLFVCENSGDDVQWCAMSNGRLLFFGGKIEKE